MAETQHHADWPPFFFRLSELYGQKATFFQVDVDEQPEVASANKVRSMPTIICFRNGVNLGQISTSSHRDVDAMIKKCMA